MWAFNVFVLCFVFLLLAWYGSQSEAAVNRCFFWSDLDYSSSDDEGYRYNRTVGFTFTEELHLRFIVRDAGYPCPRGMQTLPAYMTCPVLEGNSVATTRLGCGLS